MANFNYQSTDQSSNRATTLSWTRRAGGFAGQLGAMAVLLLLLGEAVSHAPSRDAPAPHFAFGGDQAIISSLRWLVNHQMPDGRWSLQKYTDQCKDKSCTGPGTIESDAAATAMGVLPLLAAGQTHLKPGLFKKNLTLGIDWLVAHQAADGDLSNGSKQQMYSHGLASIALCECFGITKDKRIGDAAQKAIGFIVTAQNKKSGGWGERVGDDGDTLTFCWQMQALNSARLAGLAVKPATLEGADKWLRSVAQHMEDGKENGQFADKPGGTVSLSSSAVGLLCTGMLRNAEFKDIPSVVAGAKHLMENLPDPKDRNLHYWFFATLVMHNMDGRDWDTWRRGIRKTLVESENRDGGCAAGSWDPEKPSRDNWGAEWGRLATTSLSCLTLEVPYVYLPLFKRKLTVDQRPAGSTAGEKKPGAEK